MGTEAGLPFMSDAQFRERLARGVERYFATIRRGAERAKANAKVEAGELTPHAAVLTLYREAVTGKPGKRARVDISTNGTNIIPPIRGNTIKSTNSTLDPPIRGNTKSAGLMRKGEQRRSAKR